MSDWLSGIGDFLGGAASGIGDAISSGVDDLATGVGDLFGGSSGAASAPASVNFTGDVADASPTTGGSALSGLGGAANIGTGGGDVSSYLSNINGSDGNSIGAMSGADSASLPAAAGGAAAAAGGGGGGGGIGALLKSWGISPGQALGAGITGAGLVGSLLKNNDISAEPGYKQLQQNADTLSGSATALTAPLVSGAPLPAGAQAGLTQAAAAQKQSIKAKYAQLGLSGSTMETQDLNNVDTQMASAQFDEASKLAQQGFSNIGGSSQIYDNILKTSIGGDSQLQSAIANFSRSLGGNGYPTKQTNNNSDGQ